MIPGEYFIKDGEIELNVGRKTVTMSDITITNGLNSVAAGVTLTAGTVNATNLTWSNLVGIPGGLSIAPGATFNQTNGTFSSNTAGASPGTGGNGGAVLIEGKPSAAGAPGTASFTNVTFQSNTNTGALEGGAVGVTSQIVRYTLVYSSAAVGSWQLYGRGEDFHGMSSGNVPVGTQTIT